MKRTIIILAILAAASSSALARESTEIIGARYLGMGSCFVALSSDRSVLFANPAGLDRVGGRMITAMGVGSTINSNTPEVIDFYLDNQETFDNLDDLPDQEQDEFFDLIVREINYERMTVSFSAVPFGWIQRSLGGEIFADARASGFAFNGTSDTPLVDMVARADGGGIVGGARGWTGLHAYLPNRLSVGAALKYIHRNAMSARETVTELSDGDSPEMLSGSTVGLDLGLLYDVNEKTRVGLAVYDALASDMEWEGDSSGVSRIQPGDKQEIDPALRVGITRTVSPNLSVLASPVLLAFDLAEPFDGDITFFKKIHVGAEASLFRSWFTARVGFSQGYISTGFSLWAFSYAFYTEEVGRHAGQVADHRHVVSFNL